MCLWETTTGVHLVHDKRDIACSEFLDEEVAEEVVVPGQIPHVHDLGRPPLPLECRRAGSRRCGSHLALAVGDDEEGEEESPPSYDA